MDELIDNICNSVGLDPATARSTLGTLLKALDGEDQDDTMSSIIHSIPGASELIAEADENTSGIGGMLSGLASSIGGSTGGAMAAIAQLKANGISMDQTKGVAEEIMNYARENVGEDKVEQALDSVPFLKKIMGGSE